MLFDLHADPNEFFDRGDSPDHKEIIDLMYERLGKWARRSSQRVTKSDAEIDAGRSDPKGVGIVLGVYDKTEIDPALTVKYRGQTPEKQE